MQGFEGGWLKDEAMESDGPRTVNEEVQMLELQAREDEQICRLQSFLVGAPAG
jgi:hypothetical protein